LEIQGLYNNRVVRGGKGSGGAKGNMSLQGEEVMGARFTNNGSSPLPWFAGTLSLHLFAAVALP
jgi:hypothetical protein